MERDDSHYDRVVGNPVEMNPITIGSGYYRSGREVPGFPELWLRQVRLANSSKIVVLSVGGSGHPYGPEVESVNLSGNLGHVGALLTGSEPHEFCGWSAGMLALALVAYNNVTDFVYVEQDCLVFGDWVGALYAALGGTKGIVFGSNAMMECAQSLFLVRHSFIPEFVASYLSTGPERSYLNVPESKFARLEKLNSSWGRFPFGYDRFRPFNPSDPVFYIQHVTLEDLGLLRRAGRL